MQQEIVVKIKNVYGKETIYPANKEAELFAELVGQKTLTRQNIGTIKALGFNVTIKQEEVKL